MPTKVLVLGSLFLLAFPAACGPDEGSIAAFPDVCDSHPEVCAGIATDTVQPYDPDLFLFPGRRADLLPGVFWDHNEKHGGPVQGLGTDLRGVMFTEDGWSWFKPGTYGEKNSDALIYGVPAYAIADGTVVSCWRNAPQNPRPGVWHDDFAAGLMPGGGNSLWVSLEDGSGLLYAHFIEGTIPESLCPNNKVIFDAKNEKFALPGENRPKMKKGDFLGLIGNSGQSGFVHLHIHHQRRDEMGALHAAPLLFYGAWTRLAEEPDTWKLMMGEQLANEHVAILPHY